MNTKAELFLKEIQINAILKAKISDTNKFLILNTSDGDDLIVVNKNEAIRLAQWMLEAADELEDHTVTLVDQFDAVDEVLS